MKDDDHYWSISPVSVLSTYVGTTCTASTALTLNDVTLLHRGDTMDIETASGTWASRYVTAVNYTTKVVTLNAAVTVTAGYRVVILGKKQVFGDKPDSTPWEEITDAYNAIQEMDLYQIVAEVTKSKRQRYGLTDETAMVDAIMSRAVKQLSRQLYFGTRVSDTTSTPAEAGGIKYMIDTYGDSDVNVFNVGGNLTWSNLVSKITGVREVGGFSGSRNYIYCNPKFAECIERLRKLSNASIDLWSKKGKYVEITVAGVTFTIVEDIMLNEWSRTGTARTTTGVAFFLSGDDAMGNSNFKLIYDNAMNDDILSVRKYRTHNSAEDYNWTLDWTTEVGEPQMHFYAYGATGAAADS